MTITIYRGAGSKKSILPPQKPKTLRLPPLAAMVAKYRLENKTTEKCPICGYKIRGKNHNDSEHHQAVVRGLKRKKS